MLATTHHHGFNAADSTGSCSCVTAYVIGNRTASITVTTNITWDAGTNDNLVDGATAANGTDSVDLPATTNSTDYVRFDYGGAPKYIDEARMLCLGAVTNSSWKWQGSQDALSWLDLSAAFTWDLATKVVAFDQTANLNSYRYYQVIRTASGSFTNTWFLEVEFKQCSC